MHLNRYVDRVITAIILNSVITVFGLFAVMHLLANMFFNQKVVPTFFLFYFEFVVAV